MEPINKGTLVRVELETLIGYTDSEKGIGVHAGHGLTLQSLEPLLELNIFKEFNIGHWIISEAVFQGIGPVVKSLKELINKYSE